MTHEELIEGHPALKLILEALSGSRGGEQEVIAAEGLKLTELLLRKNWDYGCSAWQEPILLPGIPPREALFVRMSDKISRMISLQQHGNPEVQESMEDTVGDLAGYCVLWKSCPEVD